MATITTGNVPKALWGERGAKKPDKPKRRGWPSPYGKGKRKGKGKTDGTVRR